MIESEWKIIAASIRGTLHAARNLPCQDAFAFRIFKTKIGEIFSIAVTDGAGSAKYAESGSRLVSDFFVSEIAAFFEKGGNFTDLNKEFVFQFIQKLQTDITVKAENQNLNDYACTFLGAVISPEMSAFMQIGDGAIVYSTENQAEEFCLFRLPQQGEYANSTFFITDNDAAENLQFEIKEMRVRDLAIFTDGLQRLALDFQTQKPYAPFFRSMLAPLRAANNSLNLEEKLSAYLDSPKINERTDDDKTLILASRSRNV